MVQVNKSDCIDAKALTDAARFQQLTEHDLETNGAADQISLDPPATICAVGEERCKNWLEWRAAPYPADRHSEYLFRSDLDQVTGPRILLSAVMNPPKSIEEYLAGYSKKRRIVVSGRRAHNNGYISRPIDPIIEAGGIWEIIHSSESRQGRKIASMYDERPKNYGFPNHTFCEDPNYNSVCSGVFSKSGELVAYLLGSRVGNHVQYDEIMGHHDHFRFDVMYFLHIQFLRQCLEQEVVPQCLNYGPWYSGENPFSPTGGLNFWKRRVGFRPAYLIAASS